MGNFSSFPIWENSPGEKVILCELHFQPTQIALMARMLSFFRSPCGRCPPPRHQMVAWTPVNVLFLDVRHCGRLRRLRHRILNPSRENKSVTLIVPRFHTRSCSLRRLLRPSSRRGILLVEGSTCIPWPRTSYLGGRTLIRTKITTT